MSSGDRGVWGTKNERHNLVGLEKVKVEEVKSEQVNLGEKEEEP